MSSNYRAYLDNFLRWKQGRQNPGYKKMLLLANPWLVPFDVYFLKFEQGTEIQPHQDKVTTGRHYRLNLIVKHAQAGGEFYCAETLYSSDRIKFFRPDLFEHSVSTIVSGSRYVLSIGWILKNEGAS